MQKTPGGTLIFVAAILMLIFGIIAALSIPALIVTLEYGGLIAANAAVGIGILAMEIVAGIMGIRFSRQLSKAGTLLVIGLIILILAAVNIVIAAAALSAMGAGGLSFMGFISLILPILYLVGANLNKKAADTAPRP